MTSKPLYYTNSYLTDFQSRIIEQIEDSGRYGIILQETAFYPSSGGQPHDTGTLNGIRVTDVTLRKADNAIIHWTASPFEVGTQVDGRVDWNRRFDHMQQHSGQHMLSQAFIQLADAATHSFHLGAQSVTIDLDIDELEAQKIREVEQYVNQIVWENRPIFIESVTLQEAQARNVRKLPPESREQIRLINIADFDLTACGGTHVGATGSVGIIKIIKSEKQNQKVRITFCCGGRALEDYEVKNRLTSELTRHFTTGHDDLIPNILKLQSEAKALQKSNSQLQNDLIAYRAGELRANAQAIGGYVVVRHILKEGSPQLLRTLAHALVEDGKTIIQLGLIQPDKTQLVFACSEDVSLNMSQLLKAVLTDLGSGSGGGRSHMAQGGTAVSDPTTIQTCFHQVLTRFLPQI